MAGDERPGQTLRFEPQQAILWRIWPKSPKKCQMRKFPKKKFFFKFQKRSKKVEKMSNKSELEKIFLLTLVQNAKCYRITRQENPEFLGEFAGGAKTPSNSGVISFEYRENLRKICQLDKQTNKMNEISSDRKPNQR